MTKASAAKRVQPPVEDTNDRRHEILQVAADLFARRGYDGVGVRQIADAAGILGGSLYHHFQSKRELYVEVHGAALANVADLIEKEIEGIEDPWERLEAACRAHLGAQVAPDSVTLPMMNDIAAMTSEMRGDLVKDRDRFEVIYKGLIGALPLNPAVDSNIYRLCLVSLINAVPMWYRSGRMSVDELAAQIVMIFRASSGAMAARPMPARPKEARPARAKKKSTK